MTSSDPPKGSPSTSLTKAALKAHDEHLSKISEPDRRHDPMPYGARCLALAEEHITDSNTIMKKHGMWAAAQINEFETAFQRRGTGD